MIKRVSQLLHSSSKFSFDRFEKIKWNTYVKPSYCIRKHGKLKYSEAKLAGPIWTKLRNPKVDLKNPKTTIEIFSFPSKVYVTKLIWQAPKNRYAGREPKEKPAFHPTGLKPRLSKLLINLSRAKQGQKLLDPFCGAGAILIEAALMKIKAYGSDIDPKMVWRSNTNLKHYKLRAQVKQIDIKDLNKKYKQIDAIVADPPYGISTKVGGASVKSVYNNFLTEAHTVLKKGKYLSFIHPNWIKLKINKKKWKQINKSDWYVHGGLTRKILVLKKC
jgi:tRNA (guanine10-N2)-dimethyltransferase